jgi:hypothetical protein
MTQPLSVQPAIPRARLTRGQLQLYAAGWIVLAAGVAGAIWSYLAAVEPAPDAIGYDVTGGGAYAIRPEDSKRYEYDMERFGGKASILAVEIREAFAHLWQGRRRAFTVGTLGLLTALACFFLADALPDLPRFDFDLSPSTPLDPQPNRPPPPRGPEAPP